MNVLSRIKLKVLDGEIAFSRHLLFDKLPLYNFSTEDVISAVNSCKTFIKQTGDIRGTRYFILGQEKNGMPIEVVCRFRSDGYLIFITIYEYE